MKLWMMLVLGHAWLGAIPARADEWQSLAEQIPYVHYGEFLYNRPPRSFGGADSPAMKALRAAISLDADFATLKARAEHADPGIRALALMKSYASGDPNAFRVIHSRLGDEGLAFPAVSETGAGPHFDLDQGKLTPRKVATEKQTVGGLARSMMDMIGCSQNADFELWAKQRLDNPDWMGWYEFLLKRVTHGTLPTPKGIDAELAEFGKLLDKRPPALRAWLGFVVADEAMMIPTEDTVLGTREELIEKGRALGPDALLGFLRDGTRAGLKFPNVDAPNKGVRFVLRHAKRLFRTNDAETLRAMGHYIAAADLRPDLAPPWIREACAKWSASYQGWDRARAMAALLDLRADKELGFVVDWFYKTEPISSGTSDHAVFVTEYHRRRPADWRTSMTALVAHPGFDSIERMALIYLALMINDLHGGKLVDEALLNDDHESELRNAVRRSLGSEDKPVKWIDLDEEGERLDPEWAVTFVDAATHMAINSAGSLIAIGMRDGKIRIHRAPDGAFFGEIPSEGAWPTTIGFLWNDDRLMVVRENGFIEFWDTGRLRLFKKTKIEGLGTTEVSFGSGGAWLASRQANGAGISVYDLETGKQRWNISMGIRAFGLIAASPAGARFAVCDGFSRTVLLFDPASEKPLARLNGHSGVPKQAVFSSDGGTMVTTGDDTKILVWNGKTGKRVSELASRRRHPRVLACSGDSTSFLFDGSLGKITRVDLNDGRVIQSLKFDGTWTQTMARSDKSVAAVVHTVNGRSTLVGWRLHGK